MVNKDITPKHLKESWEEDDAELYIEIAGEDHQEIRCRFGIRFTGKELCEMLRAACSNLPKEQKVIAFTFISFFEQVLVPKEKEVE